MSALPIRAEVIVAGVNWSALLVPLSLFEVRRNGVLVPASWDRQTIEGADEHYDALRALTLAMREAIHKQELRGLGRGY